MPFIYQGTCEHCGHRTPLMPMGYLAVFVGEPGDNQSSAGESNHNGPVQQNLVAGAVMGGETGDDWASADDTRFIVLAHPGEDFILNASGFTWKQVDREGRLVSVSHVVCQHCGKLYEHKHLIVSGDVAGCFWGLLLGVAAWIGVGFWLESVFLGFLSFAAVMWGTAFICDRRDKVAQRNVRQKFAERSAMLESENLCPSCGSTEVSSLDAKVVKCDNCKANTMKFDVVGES